MGEIKEIVCNPVNDGIEEGFTMSIFLEDGNALWFSFGNTKEERIQNPNFTYKVARNIEHQLNRCLKMIKNKELNNA